MSDAELQEEAQRRRKARARGETPGAPKKPSPPGWLNEREAAQVLQWYANLELAPGARLEDIDAAYERLVRKYHPERHRDAERKRAAEKLIASLEVAREGLKAYVRRRS